MQANQYTDPNNGVVYNAVEIRIVYTSPISAWPPNLFATINFTYTNASGRPTGENTFLCWGASPTTLLPYYTDIYQGNSTTPTIRFLTQGSHVYFHGCTDAYDLNKSFVITPPTCSHPGKITVTADNTGNSPNAIHIWDFGDPRSTPLNGGGLTVDWKYMDYFTNVNNVTQAPLQPGTYYITHTVIDGNVFAEETLPVTIEPDCCEQPVDVTISNGDQSSNYGSDISNQLVHISGEFDITNTFAFINCNVIMDPGASIVVKNGQSLNLYNSSFSGCSNMWKGIYAEQNSTVISDVGLSISDAEIGFFCENYSSFYFSGSTFHDNIVGISNTVNSESQFNSINFNIYNCAFSSSGTFKPDYTGQAAHGIYGKAGIIFNDMVGTIGNNSYAASRYSNLNSGIRLNRCNVDVTNSTFTDIHSEDNQDYGSMGEAVFAQGSSNSYYSLGVAPYVSQNNVHPTFSNCDFGVVTSYTNAWIHNNLMMNVGSGIVSTYTTNSMSVQADNNNITAKHRGIVFSENAGANSLVASGNTIKTTHPGAIGIQAEESGANYSQLFANGNTITGIESRYGISATNITGIPSIQENSIVNITYDGQESTGINLEGCDGMTVSCNYVQGPSSSSSLHTWGIKQSISPNTSMLCNSVTGSNIGIEFNGVNAGTEFKTNEMHQHHEGLHLNNVAVIDPQTQAGNLWYGPFGNGGSSYGAVNLNTAGAYFSDFYANAFAGSVYYPSVLPSSGWFHHQVGTAATCENTVECTRPDPDERGEEERTMMDLAIAGGGINTVDFLPESRNMAKHYLFEKLKGNPDLLSDATMQSFFTAESATPVSKLTTVKEGINDLTYYDQFFISNIKMADSLITVVNDSLNVLDSLRIANGNSVSLEATALSLHTKVNTLHSTIKAMVLQRNSVKTGERIVAENNNNAIVSTQFPEQNEKLINEIHLETDAMGIHTFTASQEILLLSIAQQCPFSGGMAVYKARVKYKKMHPGVIFDDASNCLSQGIYRTSQTNKDEVIFQMETNRNISIRPNPATDNATITYFAYNEIDCKMQITDLSGKLIKQFDLPLNQNLFSFSTEIFAPGLYLVKVLNNGTLIGKCKFGIVK